MRFKSVICLLLTALLLCGIFPVMAFAESSYYSDSYYDFYNWYYYGSDRYYSSDYDDMREAYRDYYYRENDYVNVPNLYSSYYYFYDEDLYRKWAGLPVDDVEVIGAKDQVYTGTGTISFTLPKKGTAALLDVVAYPTGKRDKEVVLERKVDYSVKSGLTITLKQSYLDSLKNGEYQIVIYLANTMTYASFTVDN